ncbi:MAG: replication-associated recombination protein A, partial [Desulfatiglandaceae bacterium]
AATYLASAPKSNALYRAEKSVKAEIERTGHLPVPLHLRNAPTALMKSLGYARGYLYPHHHPGGVPQAYLPEKVRNRVFYTPTDMGFEGEIRKRIANRKRQ